MDYDPKKEALVTVGGSEAVDLCFRTLINPGDEVIVLDPNYVAYEPAIIMAGGVPVYIELTQDNDFKLTPEDLKAALTEKTKCIMLNFPSNPTGGTMGREDYEKLVPIFEESGIYIVSDEIYAELTFEGEFCSPASFDSIKDQVLVINGFSKAFAMDRMAPRLSALQRGNQQPADQGFISSSSCPRRRPPSMRRLKHSDPVWKIRKR